MHGSGLRQSVKYLAANDEHRAVRQDNAAAEGTSCGHGRQLLHVRRTAVRADRHLRYGIPHGGQVACTYALRWSAQSHEYAQTAMPWDRSGLE